MLALSHLHVAQPGAAQEVRDHRLPATAEHVQRHPLDKARLGKGGEARRERRARGLEARERMLERLSRQGRLR